MKAETKKELFISVTRPGKATETIKAGARLTLGKDYACDIITETNIAPPSYVFLKRRAGGLFTLCLIKGFEGIIRKDGETVSISTLIKFGLLKKEADRYILDLNPSYELDLTIGQTVLSLRFRETQALKRAPVKLKATSPRDNLFFLMLVVSAVLHVSFAAYLSLIEIKKEKSAEEAIREMPRRFARLILMPKPKIAEKPMPATPLLEEKEAKEEKEEKKITEEKAEEKKPVKEAKEKAQETPPAAPREPSREPQTKGEIIKKVEKRGILGVIGAKGGILTDTGTRELWKDVDNIIKLSPGAEPPEDVLAGISGSTDGVSPETVLKGWEKRQKTGEEVIKEKRETAAALIPQKKTVKGQSKRQEAEVYRVVRSYIGGLKYLYNNALRKNPSLKGAVTVRLVIAADGKVEAASIERSTMDSAEFEKAVIERIYHWRFSQLEDGEDLTINYTFDFSPVG